LRAARELVDRVAVSQSGAADDAVEEGPDNGRLAATTHKA
jgi:hypothetical protein